MKSISAGLTFVSGATVYGLLIGMADHGLHRWVAVIAFLLALCMAVFAYLETRSLPRRDKPQILEPSVKGGRSKRALESQHVAARQSIRQAIRRYRSVILWLVVACFAIFAVRSFCWLLYISNDEYKVQSPNNLGDLALHLNYIRNFASGVNLWPENPIYVFSKMRYPAGIDLFNALLSCLGLDLINSLAWTGILASVATCYAFYRWAGTFGLAGFLFNGGLMGFEAFHTFVFKDYQGGNTIAWKSIPLSMFVTQRGLLYALPAGLLLLYQWRARFREQDADPEVRVPAPLPFWVELLLYASMPLFHVHTFIALSTVLPFLFLFGSWRVRKRLALLAAAAFVPATFFVWLVTDHFNAGSVVEWKPGWVQKAGEFAMPFFRFWFVNFGVWPIFVALLLGLVFWRLWQRYKPEEFRWSDTDALLSGMWQRYKSQGAEWPESLVFLLPATLLFLVGYLVKTAPWEWDNMKIIVWAYFIMLPFLWSELISRWPFIVRAGVCVALFGSGFATLFGGLAAGKGGFGLINRAEIDAVGAAVKPLPADARFAIFPTWNQPILLLGRRVALGYPGHLWTQGFKDYGTMSDRLGQLMRGAPGWKDTAHYLGIRYVYWGREEKTNYSVSQRPWEQQAKLVATGNWGTIYDLETPAAASPTPSPAPTATAPQAITSPAATGQ
jgi:hypothetical protein